jgi:GntR family transcriptional regulator, rspAB operon transcriptional repressor
MKKASTEEEGVQTKLYREIFTKIINGEFPPGKHLVEEELAKLYEVSRTPVREVLIALQRNGIVGRTRNRGARVAVFTADDVEEIYDIRKALECLAVSNAVRALKLNELLQLEQRLEALNGRRGAKVNAEQAEIDLRLHRLITLSSGNRRLIAYLDDVSPLIHSLRLMAYRNDEGARQSGEEHLAIVKAFLRRDVELARNLLAEHIEIGKREALELFFKTLTKPPKA